MKTNEYKKYDSLWIFRAQSGFYVVEIDAYYENVKAGPFSTEWEARKEILERIYGY